MTFFFTVRRRSSALAFAQQTLLQMIGNSGRLASGLEERLTTRSLIVLRLTSIFVAYLILSLFYALLNLAFPVDFTRK